MIITFSTKAGTLSRLRGRLHSARIADLVFFSLTDWLKDQANCLAKIRSCLGDGPYIVRSSCRREDDIKGSNAGAFLSLPVHAHEGLRTAIDQVIASYGATSTEDEVLIQPLLQNVLYSGVAFSHDPNSCAPYRMINWAEGRDTAVVTGGMGGRMWQQAAESPLAAPVELIGVIKLLDELLSLLGDTALDCEFAVTHETDTDTPTLWLLQVRPLVLLRKAELPKIQAERLKVIQDKVARGMRSNPFLLGKRTVFGVMPDWNPAEIIGVRPNPLALSLYRELITDAIWAYQRHNYGYRNLRSFPLMQHFFGLPYIDTRLSFNSFIPADLDEKIAGKLVDHYIDRLIAQPVLHDKVEFEIVFSCYAFDLPERLKRLKEAGFSQDEQLIIANSLRRLTNGMLRSTTGRWRDDAAKLTILNNRRKQILHSELDPLERIYWLLEDTKRYGTLPFAGLARVGFVAVQMLKSLVAVGVLSDADYDDFIAAVPTVSGQLARDRSSMDKATFLAEYGHLRPGTYDLLSPRYDETPDLYFDWSHRPTEPAEVKPFSPSPLQRDQVTKLLQGHGLQTDPIALFDFIRAGITLREWSKFNFTRNVSDALSLLTAYGAQWGFAPQDMAYCDVGIFTELHVAATYPKDLLAASIAQGKQRHRDTLKISLPPVIVRPEDVWAFEWPVASPNFITHKQITAAVVGCETRELLAGAIVCIPSADPGFDWLFSYPIAGLITVWGGANSHMAIRSGELGVPAVIGAGEMLYRHWSTAGRLHIDCAGRRVSIVQ
jgi:hypothetical protein